MSKKIIIENMRGMKFIASYSGGKDSVLSIYRAVRAGLDPVGLITTYRTDAIYSWFHGMSEDLMQRASNSLAIPLTLIRTTGERYTFNFEEALVEACDRGVQVCVFGDIDVEAHLEWCTKRCENTGLTPYLPLWGEARKSVVYDFIDSGFSSVIKIVDTTRLPESFLGRTLTKETVDEIEQHGADICGENGEYHTFVYDGPLFSKKVDFSIKGQTMWDKYAALELE